jgi:exonuclease VII small subunit
VTRDRWQADQDKRTAVNAAEAAGEVADSMAVRLEIVGRMNRGEITLEQAQAELKRIKRGAKAAGKTTRARAWRNG